MINRYIIITVYLALCFPKVTCAGTEPAKSLNGLNGPLVQNVESSQDAGIFFSQNDKKKTSDTVTANDTLKVDENTTPPEILTKEKNAKKKTKKLKPFVPSETIPADQGVDFPYDI